MKSPLLWLLAGWASLAGAQPGGAPPDGSAPAKASGPRVAFRHALVLKVADRDAAADAVIAAAEKLSGYFLQRSNDAVKLKIPVAAARGLLGAIEPLGTVVSRSTEATDLGERLDQMRTRLASREGMLQHYFKVVAGASSSQVEEVERAMTELVQEIESLRGAIQLQEHQLAYAEVVVSFSFRDRRAPVASGRSSFDWLNSVNLADLIADFGHE
jgi:hypothetical protein